MLFSMCDIIYELYDYFAQCTAFDKYLWYFVGQTHISRSSLIAVWIMWWRYMGTCLMDYWIKRGFDMWKYWVISLHILIFRVIRMMLQIYVKKKLSEGLKMLSVQNCFYKTQKSLQKAQKRSDKAEKCSQKAHKCSQYKIFVTKPWTWIIFVYPLKS